MADTPENAPFTVEVLAGVQIVHFADDAFSRVHDPVSLATLLMETQSGLEDLVDGASTPKVLLDFDAVPSISSGVLGMCVHLQKLIDDKAGQLRISGLNTSVSQVFSVTKLDSVLRVFPDRDTALHSFE